MMRDEEVATGRRKVDARLKVGAGGIEMASAEGAGAARVVRVQVSLPQAHAQKVRGHFAPATA
jgi:hypothetical protein